MALAYSSSTPAAKQSGFLGTASASIVSNTFSPPANSTIVLVIGASESYTSAWNVPTFTDSLGAHLSWQLTKTQADQTQSFGATWVAWASCPSAQTNMTVTATISLADTSQYIQAALLTPLVFTGADTSAPLVNIDAGISTTTSATAAMTPVYTGSHLIIAATRTATSATADTAGAGCYLAASYAFGAAIGVAWYGNSSGPTASNGTPQTLALSTTDTGNAWQYVAFEVAPPHGAPSVGTGWTVGAVEW